MPGKNFHALSFRYITAELKQTSRESEVGFFGSIRKSNKLIELGQSYVIKFFIDEGTKLLGILMRVHKH
jgi:hypothetical protein